MSSSNAKLAKTLQRFQSKIKAGDYYEAHQTLRTIANRYVRSKHYDDAIELIIHAATSFLEVKQFSIASDLIFYLLDVYDTAQIQVNDDSVANLIQLLVLVDADEPQLKEIATAMNNWSIKFSDFKFGEPRLHNIIASKLLEAGLVYEAERYFILGTNESLDKYVDLIWEWYLRSDDDAYGAGEPLSRLIFNYLFISNFNYVIKSRDKFLNQLLNKFNDLKYEIIDKNQFKLYYFHDEKLKDLNFLQLMIITCQTKNKDLFTNLKNQYPECTTKFKTQLEFLGQEYFDIVPVKQPNFLQDMMSGFFK
ncbi:hypothetical protein KAFR_0G02560 [Kazachstania africana CBS 2517]|uniref:Golgi to ER traffic protein 4 n=1 Tax=Kazachstania africana (strain ATCC 22294 / BCRC 22015 / CBS 2517 / CECT 1963 / NBRC 1671 / NRRL Y-8276) TaxID=1071382 RepID=H2AY38_KAZAF|nr:hypothetical protein KAFR_0G02560 [Kazachstania africana CBS 2517]CCF59288.1 hypothetical protein KAFR_0G02560 [Kazachstania africana CBS 2517]